MADGFRPFFNYEWRPHDITPHSGAFFLDEIFEKVSFDPYNFRITRLSARISEQMKNFKIRLTLLCLSGFELYSRWVPLINAQN